jgi:hypothetical protein
MGLPQNSQTISKIELLEMPDGIFTIILNSLLATLFSLNFPNKTTSVATGTT